MFMYVYTYILFFRASNRSWIRAPRFEALRIEFVRADRRESNAASRDDIPKDIM